ncbi:uncharacterized protein LOC128389189 [Panonychus citri]|uniref:uncharacterized protein LOC128389189 n=1 Tax=Panonychus citri TaxID=50023 RepID=UPI00230820FB|nr:uncharacterized protein LOC128389189 [Panonychus citri]
MALIVYRGHKGLRKVNSDRFKDKRSPQNRIIKDGHIDESTVFTFVDFIPSFCKKVQDRTVYHSFSSLVNLANEWLHRNPSWEVISCETVPQYHHSVVSEIEYSADVYTLRLWVRRSETVNYCTDDVIFWYKDFVPNRRADQSFEQLEDLIEGINEEIQGGRINGKILQIETIKIGANDDWNYHIDATYISDGKTTRDMNRFTNFLIGIRVFFQIGSWLEDEIVLVDFVPEFDLTESQSFRTKEKFSQLIDKSAKWLIANQDLNFCNAQAVDIRVRETENQNLETRRTWWVKQDIDKMVRFLRIYCTKPNEMGRLMAASNSDLSLFTHNPELILSSIAFDQKTFHQDIIDWYKNFQSSQIGEKLIKRRIATIETLIIPPFVHHDVGLSFQHSVDQTLIGSPMQGRMKYLFVAIRIYFQETPERSESAEESTEVHSDLDEKN